MKTEERMITIPLKEYRELLKSDDELRRLEFSGVDNWDGRDYEAEEEFFGPPLEFNDE